MAESDSSRPPLRRLISFQFGLIWLFIALLVGELIRAASPPPPQLVVYLVISLAASVVFFYFAVRKLPHRDGGED
jgi:Na+/proline symporter